MAHAQKFGRFDFVAISLVHGLANASFFSWSREEVEEIEKEGFFDEGR